MWAEHAEYPVRLAYLTFAGCGAPGSGPATSSPVAGSNPYRSLPFMVAGVTVALIAFGFVAIVFSRHAQIGLAGRRWIRWPYLLASVLALLGIAWTWQLSSTYTDGGCVVYVRTWPVDESSVSLVASWLILGTFTLAIVYLTLTIVLFIRRFRQSKSAQQAG